MIKTKKYISVFLIICMLMSAVSIWVLNGYKEVLASSGKRIVLINYGEKSNIPSAFAASGNKYNTSVSTGIKYSEKNTSLKWVMKLTASAGADIHIPITTSLTEYAKDKKATINFRYYSEAVGSKFNLCYYPNDANWSGNYYPTSPTTAITRKGWQIVSYNLSDILSKVKYSTYKSLTVNINDDGWGNSSNGGYKDGDAIYIDSIYIELSPLGHIVDFSKSAVSNYALNTNVTYATDKTYGDYKGALKLSVPSNGKTVDSKPVSFGNIDVSTDWSDVGVISIPIHSSTANGDCLNVIFCKNNSGLDGGYYFYKIRVNWTGWKVVNIRKNLFVAERGIADWSEIKSMYFNIGGWSSPSSIKGTTFYIPYVIGINYSNLAADNSSGSTVIYAGGEIAYKNGSKITLPCEPEFKDGRIYVPVGILPELFNMNVSGGVVSDAYISASFVSGIGEAEVGSYYHKLKSEPYESGGDLYVEIEDICGIFDIPLHMEGKFAIFGSESDISFYKSFDADGLNALVEAASKNLSSNGNSNPTVSDCDEVISNWVTSLVGNETINDMSDFAISEKIDSVVSAAESARANLIKTSGSSELFTNVKTTTTAHMTTTSQYIYNLTLAYATYGTGSEYYLNESLLDDILYCLEWFYENRYGNDEAEKNSDAWRDRSLYNWWDWGIGTPKNLISTLMIIKDRNPDALSNDDISKYLLCFEAISPNPTSTGANYLEICKLILGAAFLKGDTDKALQTIKDSLCAFEYVDDGRWIESYLQGDRAATTPEKGQGFYKDGSYVFHTLHPMNGVYGLAHLRAATELLSVLHGTAFELPGSSADIVAEWILNGFDALMYSSRMPRMALGREDKTTEVSVSYDVINAIMRSFKCFDEENALRLGSVVRAVVGDEGYRSYSLADSYGKFVDITDVAKLREISEDSHYDDYSYTNSNVFANMDKVMHKRKDWGVGISMSSSRIFNYECINNMNLQGWYLGDGATEVFLKSEGNKNQDTYWKNVDYYRIPGTTADTQERKQVSIAQGNEYLSSKDFVGGVEMDNKYSTAAMHLESYHNAEDFGSDEGDYGSKAPAHTSDLTAKKSYFMFDKEVICLGSDINASDNNNAEVLTIVENKLTNSSSVNSNRGAFTPKSSALKLTNVKWVNLDNNMGYCFMPDYSDSVLYARKVNGYFEMWNTHGTNPSGASYAYALLPGMTSAQTKAYSASPDTVVLANNSSVQAVKNERLDITSVVFWEAGTFNGITASHPMIVMLKEAGDDVSIAVADPTQKLKNATLTLEEKNLVLTGGDSRITMTYNNTYGSTALNIDFSASHGATFEAGLTGNGVVSRSVSFRLTSASGEEINRYSAHRHSGKSIYASVGLANLTQDEETEAAVYFAMYDSKGTLQDISFTAPEKLKSGEFKTVDNLSLTPNEATASMKVFVWNKNRLVPCKALYLNY